MARPHKFVFIAFFMALCLAASPAFWCRAASLAPADLPGLFSYVKSAAIFRSPILGGTHKTLILRLKSPCPVLSSLEGYKTGVSVLANHYVPRQGWKRLHKADLRQMMEIFWRPFRVSPGQGAMLITGADMDHLAVERQSCKGLSVAALVTAGVRGNAMRMGKDQGRFFEPGTINIILLTNRRLASRAMTRALITITEAKTEVLQRLDVRSAYHPVRWQATGTGTDNIMVVQGFGPAAKLSGGHSKLGELMARAVARALPRAIAMQNRLLAARPVWQRLVERKIKLPPATLARLQKLPWAAPWLEQALALHDAWQRGLYTDLRGWEQECARAARRWGAAPARRASQKLGPLFMALQAISGQSKGAAK